MKKNNLLNRLENSHVAILLIGLEISISANVKWAVLFLQDVI